MALTDTLIRTSKPSEKARKLADGGGMYLEIAPTGGKHWRLKYRFGGKEKRLALGSYPETSLKDAREKREAARKLLAAGIDPSEHRKATKAAGIELAANTFEAIARQWFTLRSSKWVASHSDKVISRLERDIFPWLGSKPIKAVARADILSVLKRVVDRGAIESARRAGFNLAQIFRFAIDNELADRNPAANLGSALPSVDIKHRAAITDINEIGGLLRAMESYQGSLVTQCALRLAPLVFVRPIELSVDFHAKLTQGFHPKLTHPWLSKFSYCFVDKSFISVLGSPVLWVLVFVRRVRGAAELCLKRQESLPVSTIWQ